MIKTAAVIMAGGKGSRLWPVSTSEFPKFLLNLGENDNRSLLRQTYERLKMVMPEDHIFLITGNSHKNPIRRNLPELVEKQIIIEPAVRDTAPAVALALQHITSFFGDETILLFLPSDHIIKENELWKKCIEKAFESVINNRESFLYFGLYPEKASGEYGYILPGVKIEDSIFNVERFEEKPKTSIAFELIKKGARWNGGMFVVHSDYLAKEMKRLAPEIYKAAEAVLKGEHRHYEELQSISIDHAIHQKTLSRIMISADYSRIDVGNWESIRSLIPIDDNGNAIMMAEATTIDCRENTFYAPDKKVLALGVSNLVVVNSGTDLLLIDRTRLGEIKKLISRVREDEDGKNKSFEILVCDWDGTLVDTMPEKIKNAASVFRTLFNARESSVVTAYKKYSGIPRRRLFDAIAMETIGRTLTESEFAQASDAFTEKNSESVPEPFPGVEDTLILLKEKKIPVVVSSSAVEEELLYRVKKSGLFKYFTAVFPSKPGFSKGPEHIEALCRKFNLEANGKILFVGDELEDIKLCLSGGAIPVAVTNSVSREEMLRAGARFVFDDFNDIINLFS